MKKESIDILFIAGHGRSGSTFLCDILGQLEDHCSLSEPRYVWDHGILENRPCGCEKAFKECKIWNKIFHIAFNGFDKDLAQKMTTIREKIARNRHFFKWRKLNFEQLPEELKFYLENIEKLYWAISEVQGCNFLVDASKSPTYAILLSKIPSFRVNILHLIRDPRGVSYSYLKRKHSGHKRLKDYNKIKGVLDWVLTNLACELLQYNPNLSYTRVLYSKLVENPKYEVRKITEFIRSDCHIDIHFLGEKSVYLKPTHTIAGSPSRFRTGQIDIRHDNAWHDGLSQIDKCLITLITSPLLARYKFIP